MKKIIFICIIAISPNIANAWSWEKVTSGAGWHSFVMDKDNNPHISFYDMAGNLK